MQCPNTPDPTPVATAAYAHVYHNRNQRVDGGEAVKFDFTGPTAGITHTAGTAELRIEKAGTYLAHFTITSCEENQFALYLNGNLIPGTIYGVTSGTEQNQGFTIFTAPDNGVITLVNRKCDGVSLATQTGGRENDTNASVLIYKIA